jgi:hypothetical protein
MSPHRRPEGAFGDVRLFAAAFENSLMCLFFKRSLESGSKLPHSKGPFSLTNWPAWPIEQLTIFVR